MNIENWSSLATVIVTIVAATPITAIVTAFFALRYAKRNALANTKKNEAEAQNSEATTESTIIANAKEIIQLYQDGVRNLTELHEKQSKELNERCEKLEAEWAEDKRAMQEQIDAQNRLIAELKTQIAVYAANTDKQEIIEKNAKLEVEVADLKKKLHKEKEDFKKYKLEHPDNGKD